MSMTATDYKNAGLSLLPTGKAWNKELDSTLSKVMLATGEELARIDEISEQLLSESIPNKAFLLLNDWEEFAGLPDCSIDDSDLIEARRAAIKTKLTQAGSLCGNFYEHLAKTRGYDVRIVEHYPHHCLRNCNYPLYPNTNWWHVFVYIAIPYSRNSTVLDNVTQRLRVADAGDLECLLEKYVPAEVKFVFIYED